MLILEEEDKELYDRIQEKNLLRQYDLLTNCIEIGLKQSPRAFDKYMLWDLNHIAVANISQFGRPVPRGADICKQSHPAALPRSASSDGSVHLNGP